MNLTILAVMTARKFSDIDSELDYVLGRPMTDEEREAQLAMIPELTDMPVTDEVTSDLDIVPYALYPEEYNSAKEGLVTPVKNQSSTSLCWDFSLTSNIETSLLSRGLGYYDLSEEHLAYFWANRVNDPLPTTRSQEPMLIITEPEMVRWLPSS